MTRKAAFFDLDGTIIPNTSSERILIKHLIQIGVLTVFDFLYFMQGIFYNMRGGWHGIFRENKFYLKGKKAQHIKSIAKEYFEKHIDAIVSMSVRDLIEKHKSKGDVLIMVSGSPYFVVEVFARKLGFNDYKGTDLIIKHGIFTGKIEGIHPFGRKKVTIIRYFAKKYGINIDDSTTYANHFKDRHILALASKPVAVNPTRRLKKYAIQKGWQILHAHDFPCQKSPGMLKDM
jgi:HAD superfamily hydrolase (TIGR01490 family)